MRNAPRGTGGRDLDGMADIHRQPLLAETEEQYGPHIARNGFLALAQAPRPLFEILGRRRALQQGLAGCRKDGTVVTVADLCQLDAGAVALDADAVPAV